MKRMYLLVLLLVSIIVPLSAPFAQSDLDIDDMMQERFLGNPDAAVTIYEYSSFTCPHCAAFHAETFSQLREHYVDTGKVKFVFRDFPLEVIALHGSLLVRCSSSTEQFFRLVEVLFREQRTWVNEDPLVVRENLTQIGLRAGMHPDKIRQCLGSQEFADRILRDYYQKGQRLFNISSTPTFIFNDNERRIQGAQPYRAFAATIDALLLQGTDVPSIDTSRPTTPDTWWDWLWK